MQRAVVIRTGVIAGLAAVALATQASAVSEPPRQTYSDRFTTDMPSASTGRTYAIDYVNPSSPEGKPHSFSHLRVELAEGSRFNTSALPYCEASDAQLMAAGASACPSETKIGTDETVVDTGVAGPGRYFTVDFDFFNNKDELILLANVRERGSRVVIRGKIGTNTLDIENPMIPGTPPDGAAAKSQRGVWRPPAGYLTTPPTCPASGFWVNRVVYTYRDGVNQTAESRSPCRRTSEQRVPEGAKPGIPAAERGGSDARGALRIRAVGVPRRCVRRAFLARVDAVGASRMVVRMDGRRIASARRARVRVRVPVARLRSGRHALVVTAVDAAGKSSVRRFVFRRCA